MLWFIARRLLALPVIMFFVTASLFFLILQLPIEQRVEIYLPSTQKMLTEEEFQHLMDTQIERYGLDRPFPVQYANWIRNLLQGELGYSATWRQPVAEGLKSRTPASLELAIFTSLPAVVLALLLGTAAARNQHRFRDRWIRLSAYFGWAFPTFILGIILIKIFYARLGWFPIGRLSTWAGAAVYSDGFHLYTGLYTVDALLNQRPDIFFDALHHLVLPGVTLAVVQYALLARVMRDSLADVLRQDYITTARAKGLKERQVVNLHARRNALVPVISMSGVSASLFIGNLVVVEILFNINGVGRSAAQSVLRADIPVTVGFTLLSSVVVVLANLAADVLSALIDPRLRER